ncbi:MAG: hypothetical protein LBP22_05735 [Deltaproteobacteria bacterium]|nr:hypothetical protein [Deltaproteobacteria bacterium]
MLSDDTVPAFAYYSRRNKLSGESSLSARDSQPKVEIWKYSPVQLSDNPGIADPLSVIVSIGDAISDPRMEQAANEIY